MKINRLNRFAIEDEGEKFCLELVADDWIELTSIEFDSCISFPTASINALVALATEAKRILEENETGGSAK